MGKMKDYMMGQMPNIEDMPEERMFIVIFTYDYMNITSWAAAVSADHAIDSCLSTVMAECGKWTLDYLDVAVAEMDM